MPDIQMFHHLPNVMPAPAPAGILDPPRTPANNPINDEFEGTELSAKWHRASNTRALEESYNDKIRSALYLKFAASATEIYLRQFVNIGNGDFTLTLCASAEITAATHFFQLLVSDLVVANAFYIDVVFSTGAKIRSSKYVATVQSQVDITATLTHQLFQDQVLLHMQRSGNNWTAYYSRDGVVWTKLATTSSISFNVEQIRIAGGPLGATRNQVCFHWIRKDWLLIA